MSQKKEIVVILMGQVKNFHPLVYNFKTNMHQYLYDISDFILITSKNKTYINPRQDENHTIDHASILQYLDFSKIIYDGLEQEDSILCETLHQQTTHLVETFGGAWDHNSILSTYNHLKQLYSLHLLYDIMNDQDLNYNKYIVLRSDIYYDTPFQPEWLENPEDMTVSKHSSWRGYNDRYAILNQKAFTSYCSRYKKITQNPQHLHAESYLKQILDQDGITVKEEDTIRFSLMRSDGRITSDI